MLLRTVATHLLLLTTCVTSSSITAPACADDPKNPVCISPPSRSTQPPPPQPKDACWLYLAPSSIADAGWGIYTTQNLEPSTVLEDAIDMVLIEDHYKTIPYRDNKQRFSNWMGYIWPKGDDAFYHSVTDAFPIIPTHGYATDEGLSYATTNRYYDENNVRQSTFRPGLSSLMNSHNGEARNVQRREERYVTSKEVMAGSELFMHYGNTWHAVQKKRWKSQQKVPQVYQDLAHYNSVFNWTDLPSQEEKYNSINPKTLHKRTGERGVDVLDTYKPVEIKRKLQTKPNRKSVTWVEKKGHCLTRVNADGKAQASVKTGNVITTSPVLAIARDDLNIYEVYKKEGKNKVPLALNFTKGVIGLEPILDLTYGDERSDLLLLPYGPYAHMFETTEGDEDGAVANAVIRFSTTDPVTQELLKLHPLSVINSTSKILVDFVALTDISPGEPIVLDYGPAFQHERTVPDGLYPDQWLNTPVEYIIQDVKKPLQPGELQQLVWQHNQEPVTTHAYRLGLEPGFSQKLLEYSQDLGIVDIYKRLLNDDILESDDWYVFNATTPAGQEHQEWFAQRYKSKSWSFNMHYIAAWSESARVSFLRGLNQAGFGNALESLGTQLEVDELTCFHVSYMGVSHCENSMMHTDVYATDWKGFNILFPIKVVDGSKEELDIQARDANVVTSVHYEYDHAIVMGDWGYHKTSPNSFENDEIRIVVGMYCAEMTLDNMNQLAHIYNGEDPAPFMNQFTNYDEREVHWSRKGGANLPE